MKTLTQFLKEALNEAIVNKEYAGLKVIFDGPIDLFVKAPQKYNESDITLYLEDCCLNKLPGAQNDATRFFGINASNISDRYFQYSSCSVSQAENPTVSIDWDSHYDTTITSDDALDVFEIKNIKYILEFDKFIIKDIEEDKLEDTLNRVFLQCVSNETNKYPIEISLNPANIIVEEV